MRISVTSPKANSQRPAVAGRGAAACHQSRGIVTCSDSRAKSSAEEDGCGGGDLRRDSRRGGGRSLAAEGTAMRSAAAVKRNTDTTMTYATLVANDAVVSNHCMAPAARLAFGLLQ